MSFEMKQWLESTCGVQGAEWTKTDSWAGVTLSSERWCMRLAPSLRELVVDKLTTKENGEETATLEGRMYVNTSEGDGYWEGAPATEAPTYSYGEVAKWVRHQQRIAGLTVLPPPEARESPWTGGPAWQLRTDEDSEAYTLALGTSRHEYQLGRWGWSGEGPTEQQVTAARRAATTITWRQFKTAALLAAAHSHHWGDAVLRAPENEEMRRTQSLLTKAPDNAIPLPLVDEAADAFSPGPASAIYPVPWYREDGVVLVHRTTTGRLSWEVSSSGDVLLTVHRPSGPVFTCRWKHHKILGADVSVEITPGAVYGRRHIDALVHALYGLMRQGFDAHVYPQRFDALMADRLSILEAGLSPSEVAKEEHAALVAMTAQ